MVSILISSEFLQMRPLVKECLIYFHAHINEIIKIPLDMNCIGADLLTRLARRFTVEELDDVRDRKDKVLSKLYMRKTEQLLAAKHVHRCRHCRRVYSSAADALCLAAAWTVDREGRITAHHESYVSRAIMHVVMVQ